MAEIRHPMRRCTKRSSTTTTLHATKDRVPFCLTVSKDVTKSESEPGKVFGRICC